MNCEVFVPSESDIPSSTCDMNFVTQELSEDIGESFVRSEMKYGCDLPETSNCKVYGAEFPDSVACNILTPSDQAAEGSSTSTPEDIPHQSEHRNENQEGPSSERESNNFDNSDHTGENMHSSYEKREEEANEDGMNSKKRKTATPNSDSTTQGKMHDEQTHKNYQKFFLEGIIYVAKKAKCERKKKVSSGKMKRDRGQFTSTCVASYIYTCNIYTHTRTYIFFENNVYMYFGFLYLCNTAF